MVTYQEFLQKIDRKKRDEPETEKQMRVQTWDRMPRVIQFYGTSTTTLYKLIS